MRPSASRLQRAPKAELHVHLEGSGSDAFWERQDPLIARMVRRFREHGEPDLDALLACMRAIHQSLSTPADYERLCADVLDRLIADGVRYAELTWAPGGLLEFHGVPPAPAYRAIERSLLGRRSEIDARLLVDLIRNQPLALAEEVVMWLRHDHPAFVVGVNVGGDEQRFPVQRLAPALVAARELRLGLSIHAGECVAEDVALDAIRAVRPDRVGHATSIASPKGIDVLVAASVHVEACPSSNTALGYLQDYTDHPILRFGRLRGSLNTDDRSFFRPSLTDLLAMMLDAGIPLARLASLQRQAAHDAFAAAPCPALGEVDRYWSAPAETHLQTGTKA